MCRMWWKKFFKLFIYVAQRVRRTFMIGISPQSRLCPVVGRVYPHGATHYVSLSWNPVDRAGKTIQFRDQHRQFRAIRVHNEYAFPAETRNALMVG